MKILSLLFAFLFIFVCNSEDKIEPPVNNSYIAFTIPEKELLAENIAYDPIKDVFYLGSTRKGAIYKLNKDGSHEEFITPRQDGLWMIIGMKIDAERRILWACSSGGNNLIGYNKNNGKEGRPAGVFKFDLNTGKLLKKYIFDEVGETHFFNDLTIKSNGDVFVTHMFEKPTIYSITQKNDQLEKFFTHETLSYPNGITLSDNEKHLYVAHSKGIKKIEIKTKKSSNLTLDESLTDLKLRGIDGLYFYKNSLIGVFDKSVQQFFLNSELNQVKASRILEKNHPMMNRPTTGVIANDYLYYIANAQFDSFNKDGFIFPPEQLYETIILKLNLNDLGKP